MIIYVILLVLVLVLIFLIWLVPLIKKHTFYFPSKNSSEALTFGNEFFVLTSDKIKIHCSRLDPEQQQKEKIVLFSHGNARNISNHRTIPSAFLKMGYQVFVYDYRGYGKSGGAPSEEGLFLDIESVWNHLTSVLKIKPTDIILVGNSLGTAVTAHLIKKRVNCHKVILQAGFYSMREAAKDILPSFLLPLTMFITEFPTHQMILNSSSPILFIHSLDDKLLPIKHSQDLHRIVTNSQLLVIQGSHNKPLLDNVYFEKVSEFLL